MANVHADPREQDHTRSVRPRTEAVPVGPPGSYVILAANHPTLDPRNTMQRELATSLAAQANLCEHDFSLWPPCASTYANRVTRRMVFDMISDLFSQAAPGRIRFLSFIGHGAPLSGDWEVVDGAISLQDILFEWRRHNPLSETTKECDTILFLLLASCYSGCWVDACKQVFPAPPDVFIQSSVQANERSSVAGFTRHWLRAFSSADKFDAGAIIKSYRQTPQVYAPPNKQNYLCAKTGLIDVRSLFATFSSSSSASKNPPPPVPSSASTSPPPLPILAPSPSVLASLPNPQATLRTIPAPAPIPSSSSSSMVIRFPEQPQAQATNKTPAAAALSTSSDAEMRHWNSLAEASLSHTAVQNEAGYRQIIASKERVIVGLLNEKEENKIAYEQLRKQNELLKARLQALQAQGSSSSSSSGLPLLPPAAQDVKGDELATLHKKLKALEEMVEDAIVCPVCHEPTPVPRELECGHMVCEPCLKSWDSASNPLPLGVVVTAATPQHHTNRKCPMCRALLVGPGYKSINLRKLAQTFGTKSDLNMKVEYEVDSNERKALIDLRIKYLKQVEMGEFAAQQFALLLTREQQMQGVLVFFHPTSTHAFLQSFGTYLVRVHLYDVQYDIAGRVMTVRLLLAANVVVRQPLGTTPTTAANAGTAPNSQPSTGGAQLAPAMVVSSAPPVVNNADLYRYGIHVMPDRRIVILPAPPLSATAVPKESSPGGTASSKTNDEEEEEEEEKDGDQAMQSSSSSASSSSSSSSSWSSSSASSTPPPAQWPEGTGERIQTGSSNVPPTYLSDIRQLESARST